MGNGSSSPVKEDGLRYDSSDERAIEGSKHSGFRVLGIQEQSPASAVGFVSFFDFILEANGIRLVRHLVPIVDTVSYRSY